MPTNSVLLFILLSFSNIYFISQHTTRMSFIRRTGIFPRIAVQLQRGITVRTVRKRNLNCSLFAVVRMSLAPLCLLVLRSNSDVDVGSGRDCNSDRSAGIGSAHGVGSFSSVVFLGFPRRFSGVGGWWLAGFHFPPPPPPPTARFSFGVRKRMILALKRENGAGKMGENLGWNMEVGW